MGAEQGAGVISPRVCSKLRGYSKNEGLGMKNTAQALSPASTRVYRVFLPQRRSVKPSKVQRSCWVMSSKVRTKGPKGTLIRGASGSDGLNTLTGYCQNENYWRSCGYDAACPYLWYDRGQPPCPGR